MDVVGDPGRAGQGRTDCRLRIAAEDHHRQGHEASWPIRRRMSSIAAMARPSAARYRLRTMIPRLYVTASLGDGQRVALDGDRTHYLKNVMRRQIGDEVGLFNGRDGEWLGRIHVYGRGSAEGALETERRPQAASPDLWLPSSAV